MVEDLEPSPELQRVATEVGAGRGLTIQAGSHFIDVEPDVEPGRWRVELNGEGFASRLEPADAIRCVVLLAGAARCGWTGP